MAQALVQTIPRGAGAGAISTAIEVAISEGGLETTTRLPSVRALASALDVSPATVAAAYRRLRERGFVRADRKRGTVVAPQPPIRARPPRWLPPSARDLSSGNPDPSLLPPLSPALANIDPRHKLYGGTSKQPGLMELAAADFAGDGIAGDIAVVGGALDGIERVLQANLRVGDRIAVEDPTWPRIPDLLYALGLEPEPVEVDESGLVPTALAAALKAGALAVIATPRGQNPTGAALDAHRQRLLCDVLARHPDVLVVEDDYVAAIAGVPYFPMHGESVRWVVVRSLSKVLGPDLRLAVMAGDQLTISRVEGRQVLAPGWVSHLLQQIAAYVWASAASTGLLNRAALSYGERRSALVEALAERGIKAYGRSGLGVWVPLAEEVSTVQLLLESGWAVSPGERFRFRTPPGIRITTADLASDEASQLAEAIVRSMHEPSDTYAG